MKKKLFVAINLPQEVKRKLLSLKKELKNISIKWTDEDNLHSTLFYIGFVPSEENWTKKLEEVTQTVPNFNLIIKDISYAPPESKIPRMIWANVVKSEPLLLLRKKMTEEPDSQFQPHITLAKINSWEFRKLDPEEWPIIEKELDIIFAVNSIELMESRVVKGKNEYETLESFQLFNQL